MPIDRFLRLAATLAAALAACLLAGCANGPSNIEISDGAFIPSGRISVPIISKQQAPPSTPQNGHAIKAGYTGAKGSDKQELETSNDPVLFEGLTFAAPVELKHQYAFHSGELLYRWRKFFGSNQKFGVEALGGVGHSIFYLSTTGGGLMASRKYNTWHVSVERFESDIRANFSGPAIALDVNF